MKTVRAAAKKTAEVRVLLSPMPSVSPRIQNKATRFLPAPKTQAQKRLVVECSLDSKELHRPLLRSLSLEYQSAVAFYEAFFVRYLNAGGAVLGGSKELSLLKETTRQEVFQNIGRHVVMAEEQEHVQGLYHADALGEFLDRKESRKEFESQQFGSESSQTQYLWTTERPTFAPNLSAVPFESASTYSAKGNRSAPTELARAALWQAYLSQVIYQTNRKGFSLNHPYMERGAEHRFCLMDDLKVVVTRNGFSLVLPAAANREFLDVPVAVPLSGKLASNLFQMDVVWASVYKTESGWRTLLEFQPTKANPPIRPGEARLVRNVDTWLQRYNSVDDSDDTEDPASSSLPSTSELRMRLFRLIQTY